MELRSMDLTEKTLSRKDIYNGHIVHLHVDEVALPDGSRSVREIIDHCPCVAVVALDGQDRVLTVTQYRYAFGRELLEIPAGKLEPGEDPVTGALRELKEETGAVPGQLLPMGVYLGSPGCLGEELHLFLARDLQMADAQPDADEFLEMARVPFDEMVHRIMSGEITDGKTIAAVLKAKLLLDL